MEIELTLQIILTSPTTAVDFGLQKGTGNNYETVQKQRSTSQNLSFKFTVIVKGDKQKDAEPKFSGPFVQGPSAGKFVYIDIGTYAGQTNTQWARRLKIPLYGITWDQVEKIKSNPDFILECRVPGTGKDGGPNCATVKPFDGWQLKQP